MCVTFSNHTHVKDNVIKRWIDKDRTAPDVDNDSNKLRRGDNKSRSQQCTADC